MRHSKILISIMMVLGVSTMLIITSCEEDAGTSSTSLTSLTSLTYSASTINAVVGTEISAITPTVEPEGATATYKVDPALPADLTLDPSSGAITGTPQAASLATQYTVTATGTGDYTGEVTAKITITVVALDIKATEMAKTLPNEDRRYHYVAFTIESKDGSTNLGRYKFGLKASDQPKPTVDELKNGDGIYRIVNATVKSNVLAYTLDSGIEAFMSNTQNQGKVIKHDASTDVDSRLLRPGTTYRLYGVKADGNAVGSIADLSTDAFDGDIYTGWGRMNDEKLYDGGLEYPYDAEDAVFIFPGMHTGDLNNVSLITLHVRHHTVTPEEQIQFLTGGSFTIIAGGFGSRSALVPSLGGTQTTGEAFVTVGGKTLGIGLLATPIPTLVLKDAYLYSYVYDAGNAIPQKYRYSAILDN